MVLNSNFKNDIANNKEIGEMKKERKNLGKLMSLLKEHERKGVWKEENINKVKNKIKKEEIEIIKEDNEDNLKIVEKRRKEITNEIKKATEVINKEKIKQYVQKLKEGGEKRIKEFYRKLNGKDKKFSKSISSVRTMSEEGDLNIVVKPNEVLKEVGSFWKELFTSKTEKRNYEPIWMNKEKEKLRGEDELMEEIELEELEEVIKEIGNKKATGNDEIPIEIYKDANPLIRDILVQICNICLKHKYIPKKWKEGRLYPIYKGGDQYDQNNFRPVCLLQTHYKIFSSILNKRLYKIVEENKVISKLQGAWQKNKYTTDNAKIVVSQIEDSIINKKEIHLLYIDIRKAFDSVEKWGIKKTLKYYRFPKEFIRMIIELYGENLLDVITAHGMTEKFEVGNGVRQGDPLSPIIFMLWINPFLEYIEDMDVGYKIKKEKVPGLAFADDIILNGSNREELERIYEALLMFCEYYGIKINQSKSAYTYNNTKEEYDSFYFENIPIKKLNKKESYKYLGIWINLKLNWDKMKSEIENGYKKHVNMLKRKRITTDQKIEIINIITYSRITYRMNVIKFEEEFSNNYPQWFWEALCDYEARMVNKLSVNYAKKKGLTLYELNSSKQIYNLGYTIVEYMVTAYGKDKLPEFIRSYGDFERVFNVSEKTFENEWRQFVADKY